MVTLVSAMFVDKIILRTPGGAGRKTRFWSPVWKDVHK
jgi:hypothetical protein